MKYSIGRVVALLLTICLTAGMIAVSAFSVTPTAAEISERVSIPAVEEACRSAILMEASTGQVLWEMSADSAMPPASVTKIMTLLLVMEALESGAVGWEDKVTASARASSMGGSQIFLKEGEVMSLRDLVKSVVISSANDAAVALAEHVAGSEEAFVERMNCRASELGMTSTHFENTNGLDDTARNHVTSARDIAIMSRALIAHKEILTYSSTWMDTIRDGAFGLTNTNRLVRYYPGCNGLKTGSTQKAGFCVSVTAERDGMTLICVIMGADSRASRNAAAKALLDWGFATYGLFTAQGGKLGPVAVTGGTVGEIELSYPAFTAVLPRGDMAAVEHAVELPESLTAPVRAGEAVGKITYTCKGKPLGEVAVTAAETSLRPTFWDVWRRMLGIWIG